MTSLTPEILLRAYAVGLFPMAEHRDDPTLYWVDPDKRGVLPLDDFHVPRRLRRTVRRGEFEVCCNTAFADVIRACAAPGEKSGRKLDQRRDRFALHHSQRNGSCALSGGLEGWRTGRRSLRCQARRSSAKAWFSTVRDASKVALVHLVARLGKGGSELLDTQFVTDH